MEGLGDELVLVREWGQGKRVDWGEGLQDFAQDIRTDVVGDVLVATIGIAAEGAGALEFREVAEMEVLEQEAVVHGRVWGAARTFHAC